MFIQFKDGTWNISFGFMDGNESLTRELENEAELMETVRGLVLAAEERRKQENRKRSEHHLQDPQLSSESKFRQLLSSPVGIRQSYRINGGRAETVGIVLSVYLYIHVQFHDQADCNPRRPLGFAHI